VEDLAEVHNLALRGCKSGTAEAYNVGTGTGNSVLEIIAASRDVTGHAIPTVETPRRPGDPPALYADATKIRQRYGWQPRYPDVRETICTAWNWHRAHPRGFGE
jgi:UDP-glucose 4-epimerase